MQIPSFQTSVSQLEMRKPQNKKKIIIKVIFHFTQCQTVNEKISFWKSVSSYTMCSEWLIKIKVPSAHINVEKLSRYSVLTPSVNFPRYIVIIVCDWQSFSDVQSCVSNSMLHTGLEQSREVLSMSGLWSLVKHDFKPSQDYLPWARIHPCCIVLDGPRKWIPEQIKEALKFPHRQA